MGGGYESRTHLNGFADRYLTAWFTHHGFKKTGADNGTRTRALDLGKVALYQLSYVRKRLTRIFYFTQCNFIKQYKAQIENFKACGIF